MAHTIEDLQREMELAASELDFEKAKQIRDRINLIRGGASAAEAEQADTSDLTRQRPGAMGLGTNRQQPIRPAGWKPPQKPDPMTSGRKRK
ncbi:UvrB/UvrC motif-containing protein [Aurantiacibacter rhizosphaerae]|uniref:Excinuclease ABC subunit B n=1 Tax=Aurantiacibacter rhizosphaerae TaxID=2691582 RepID=A0A844XBW2_9SPHN|nr:UvrB/UvrC motif-containing protein [Aurantiacibacter rhizosphaerae]MWV27124.1 excinuclease ABC subunit B [Aurantiacibacter rhizosphaerae]